MSRLKSQTNHASSLLSILLGAFLFICFARTAQASQWPWQSQKPLLDYAYDNSYAQYPEYLEGVVSSPVIGIHLGAKYASVAIYRNNSVEIITDKHGSRVIPNVVKFTKSKPLIGEHLEFDPAHTVYNMERLIGRKFDDPAVQEAIEHFPFKVVDVDNEPRIEVQLESKSRFSPEEITAIILRGIKKKAEEYLEANVTYAVITVPADFNDAQIAATKYAGTLAGLNIIRTIAEPTAAALAYNLHNVETFESRYDQYMGRDWALYEERNILVYNLGNYSLSANILIFEDGVFEVMSTVRDVRINSTSFDNSRFADTIALVEKAMLEKNITKTNIHHIVITGGSADVAHMLEEYFGRPPLRDIDPDEVIAHGAALQGYFLSDYGNNEGCLIGYVSPLAMGIETSGGTLYTIIRRGTTIPTKKSLYFTTSVDNQTSVLIQMYEGARPYTNVSNFLGEFELKGIPPAEKGVPEIKVTFELESNGLLKATANNMNNSITVNFINHEGRLYKADVKKLIEEAERYYEYDKEVDLRNEIESYAFYNGTREERSNMRLVEKNFT